MISRQKCPIEACIFCICTHISCIMINATNEKKTEKKPEDLDIQNRKTIDDVIGKKILTPDEVSYRLIVVIRMIEY